MPRISTKVILLTYSRIELLDAGACLTSHIPDQIMAELCFWAINGYFEEVIIVSFYPVFMGSAVLWSRFEPKRFQNLFDLSASKRWVLSAQA